MKRRTFVMMSTLGVLALLACGKSDNLKSLTVDQVDAALAKNDGKTLAYDCNSKESYDKGHLPGAKWVDYDNVTAADLPADKGVQLVFYCASEL